MVRAPKDFKVTVESVQTAPERGMVRTGASTAIASDVQAVVVINDRWRATLNIRVALGGKPALVEMALASLWDEDALTTTTMRRVLVDQILAAVVAAAETPVGRQTSLISESRPAQAAEIYQMALASGSRAPHLAVARTIGVSSAQASRYIRQARDNGLLQ